MHNLQANHHIVAQSKFAEKQKGSLVLDITIGAVVLSLFAAVIVYGIPALLADYRAGEEVKEVSLAVTKAQKKFANRPTFVGFSTSNAISNDIFPTQRAISTSVLNNRWGGTITASSSTLTTTNDSAVFTYTNVPAAECKSIIPDVETNFRVISVGGTTVKADGVLTDLDALGSACSAGGSANTIAYTFAKA